MEKYEFKNHYPLWMWIIFLLTIVGAVLFSIVKDRYGILLVWLPSFIFLLFNASRTYTITPETFTMKVRWMKPLHVFPLQNITEIEKEYTKNNRFKSIVIRYYKGEMHHNFLVIKKDETDIEGILNAILDYRPSVPVR